MGVRIYISQIARRESLSYGSAEEVIVLNLLKNLRLNISCFDIAIVQQLGPAFQGHAPALCCTVNMLSCLCWARLLC